MSVSKMIMGQAANQYVAPTYVEDVFSTDLWEGNGTARSITNGIDLSGQGGLVWFKMRNAGFSHRLVDTERGATKKLETTNDAAEGTEAQGLTAFNSNGFTIGTAGNYNLDNYDLCSWTFRKQPKFFDIVTWTGNGTENRTISHNLGSVPGMIIVKAYSFTEDWNVYHRSTGNAKYLQLNSTAAAANVDTGVGGANLWMSTDPTSTTFKIDEHNRVNANGQSYVAYLFAHNDGDGGFGLTNDQDIIKCGSYTGSGQPTKEIDLGFEPQWIMVKNSTDTSYGGEDWYIFDNMRGMVTGDGDDPQLFANKVDAEQASNMMEVMPTGFRVTRTTYNPNVSGETYIYMAIRRPMATPTSATDVFDVNTHSNNSNSNIFNTGFNPDMNITTRTAAAPNYILSRLTGAGYLQTELSNAEVTSSGTRFWDKGNNLIDLATNWWGQNDVVSWSWKRAPGYFDVVAYTGNSTSNTELKHNLGAVPEMVWTKQRTGTRNFTVYHTALGNNNTMFLSSSGHADDESAGMHATPTATSLFLKGSGMVNASGQPYIAYLFATLAGVSKVGSYTGTGNNIDIDCGFSSGARFVLIKRTDASIGGSWWVVDTVRGLTSSNDPIIRLDTNDAQYTQFNPLTPLSSGFTVASTATADFNASGGSYIFYAIA